jgi:DNA repair protein RAD16
VPTPSPALTRPLSPSLLPFRSPWWNPASEYQALDRTHRLGQHRSITAIRFIVKGTIEERIVALQDKKRLVFEGTIGSDAGSLARLTEEDMRFLFT